MLSDRDSLLRKLHELRSEHRDLDTVIARLADQGGVDQLHLQRLKKRKLMLQGRDRLAGEPADPGQHRLTDARPAPPLVGIIMGSQSDWPTLRHAAETLAQLGVPHEARIVSAHRTPDRLRAYATTARERGPEGDHRRRRRRRPPARHVRRLDAAAGAGRAGRIARPQGHGQPALDRPDAGRHPGRHAGDRPGRAR